MSENLDHTMKFKGIREDKLSISEILKSVCEALKERGYDPENQIVGYILSGDPTYITSHNDARKMIGQIERDDLLAAILKSYFENNDIV